MADTELYFLVQWEDRFISIIRPKDVMHPQKKCSQYQEGEMIQAAFQKKIYKAVISEIHPNKKFLHQQLKLPLKYEYHRQTCKNIDPVQRESVLSSAQIESPISVESSSSQRKEQNEAGLEGAENVLYATGRGPQSLTSVELSSPERIIQAGQEESVQEENMSSPTPRESLTSVKVSLPQKKTQGKEGTGSKTEKAGNDRSCVVEETRSGGWEDECRSLRRKIRRMEERITALESRNTEVEDPELLAVEHLSDPQEVLVTLAKTIFTEDELRNCSRTGKMTNKCKDSPRPPLAPSKLSKLERLVRKKTGVSKEIFNKKLENLQKVIRRK